MQPDLSKWFTEEEVATLTATLDEWGAVERSFVRNRSDYKAVLDGCYFDVEAANRFSTFCEKFIRQVNGEWQGKPFKLFDWQEEFVTGPLFGWKKPDGNRRFSRAYVSVPKKNGKSGLSAAIQLYMLMADGETGANCFCAAMDRKQAGLVWGEAAKYVNASPELKKRLNVIQSTKRITFEAKASFLTALSADKDTAEGIDAHCVVYDELHMAKSDALYDILRFAGAARRQPLFIVITTAGDDTLSICYKEYDYAKKVLSGETCDTSFLPCVFEADPEDDPGDPDTWRKANPSLGLTIKEEELRDSYNHAVETGKLANFQRRRLNLWVKADEVWIPRDKWDACEAPADFDWSVVEALPCFMGLDLANTQDINALALVWCDVEGDGPKKTYLKTFFWCPEDAAVSRSRNSFVPYVEWARDGWLFTTPGAVTDYGQIERFILEKVDSVQLREVGYDPWGANHLANRLAMEGVPMVQVPQRLNHLSLPTKELERLVLSGELVHDGNPVMGWMVGNVSLYQDMNENVRPDKKRSLEKIDGVGATVTALSRAVSASQDSGELFNGTGLVVL